MTDNFDKIKSYLIELGLPETPAEVNDYLVIVNLIKRNKDCNRKEQKYCFKTYYIDSIHKLDFFANEIKQCCKTFGLRAYIGISLKSKYKAVCDTCKTYMDMLNYKQVSKPWRTYVSSVDSQISNDKRWIVDIDTKNSDVIEFIRHAISICKSKYDNPIILELPTKNGCHLLTYPFDQNCLKAQFRELYTDPIKNELYIKNIPELKTKNQGTLLYEDIN